MIRMRGLWICVLALQAAALVPSLPAVAAETVAALSPEPRAERDWWSTRFVEKLAERDARKDEIGLVFIGDSITHGWENAGEAVWNEYFAQYGAFNIGYSGDRTEHVLWRLQHGEVEGLKAKGVVIMIGTNNTGHSMEAAENTAAGVAAILGEIKKRLPRAKVLLLAIFPRGEDSAHPMRVLNEDINERLKKLDRRRNVRFLDINDIFLTDGGVLTKEIMPDLLHPKEKGYRLWAEAIAPSVREMMDK